MIRRRILLAAGPLSVLSAVVLTSIIIVGAIGGATSSGRPASVRSQGCGGAVTGSAVGLDPAQGRNAAIIATVALGGGLGPVGAAIGIAVAMAESTLFNYANDGTSTLIGSMEGRQLTDAERAVAGQSLAFPHDKVGNNLDSIGLFQQRPMTGWGSPAELIDPATAAGLFFDRLQRVPGWEGQPPWQAGQIVQGSPSSDGGIYRDTYEHAVGIVAQLIGPTSVAAQPISMPAFRDPASLGRAAGVGGRRARWWVSPVGWVSERADPRERVVPGAVPAGVAVGVHRSRSVRRHGHGVPGGVRAGHRDHRRLPVLRGSGRVPRRKGIAVRGPRYQ